MILTEDETIKIREFIDKNFIVREILEEPSQQISKDLQI